MPNSNLDRLEFKGGGDVDKAMKNLDSNLDRLEFKVACCIKPSHADDIRI